MQSAEASSSCHPSSPPTSPIAGWSWCKTLSSRPPASASRSPRTSSTSLPAATTRQGWVDGQSKGEYGTCAIQSWFCRSFPSPPSLQYQVRVYDVNQLSLKFERHLNAEIVDFQILSEDYSKAVFLCDDRRLDFHAKFGSYHKTRVPRAGRCLTYSHPTAELFVAGSAPEIWRLSLEEGRFMAPMPAASPGVNALGLSPAHGLLAAAGEEGLLECYDPRVRASVGSLEAARAAGADGQGLTALRFDDSGMHVAVGTSGGLVAVFDLRSQVRGWETGGGRPGGVSGGPGSSTT